MTVRAALVASVLVAAAASQRRRGIDPIPDYTASTEPIGWSARMGSISPPAIASAP